MKRSRWIILPAVILFVLCLLCGCKSKNSGNTKEGNAADRQPSRDEIVLPSDELKTDRDLSEKGSEPSGSEGETGSVASNSSEGGSQESTEADGTQHPSTENGGTGKAQEPSVRTPILLPEIELN